MIKKFIIRKSPKFKGITKLPAQKKPKVKAFSSDASILRQHRAEKLAAKSEAQAMSIGLERVRAKGMQLFSKTKFYTTKPGTNFTIKTKEGKRALGIVERAKTRAIKIARTKGISTLESKSKSLSVPIRRFGSQKTKARIGMSESEGRILGFAPREMSSEMKAFYSKGKPSALVKKHRATLSKVYKMKKSKLRADLKHHYRTAAKSELKQAKIDRDIFRSSTIQQEFKTKSGKRTYKTIRSPEKTYDVHTKRWKRTELF